MTSDAIKTRRIRGKFKVTYSNIAISTIIQKGKLQTPFSAARFIKVACPFNDACILDPNNGNTEDYLSVPWIRIRIRRAISVF